MFSYFYFSFYYYFHPQIVTCHAARIAVPGVWPPIFVGRGHQGRLDWLVEVGAMGPHLRAALETVVRDEGPVPLYENITIKKKDGTCVFLSPSLTLPSWDWEVVTTMIKKTETRMYLDKRIIEEDLNENVDEEEEFEEMLNDRRGELEDDERLEEEILEEEEAVEDEGFDEGEGAEEEIEVKSEGNEKKEKKEEREEKEAEPDGLDAEERRRLVRQRRRSKLIILPSHHTASSLSPQEVESPSGYEVGQAVARGRGWAGHADVDPPSHS